MEQQIQDNSIKHRIKSTATTVILILAVLVCLYIAVQVMTTGHANLFGFSLFRVVTGSMEPTIPVGSLLLSQQATVDEVAIGDIVCFYSKDSDLLGRVITHRVTDILEGINGEILLQTKGDANAVTDFQYVTAENIIGKVIYCTGEGNVLSEILSFFTTKIGFFGCIVFPCLVIAGVILKDCVKSIRGELNNMMDELDQEKPERPAEQTQQEYEEMAARIRAELIEELTQGAEEKSDN